ncbi:MAG: Hsp70 family protein [Actinomycetota bacterium]
MSSSGASQGSSGATGGAAGGGSAGYHLGIDLGTTYVAAGILRHGRPEIVTLGDRAPVVPSVLFFKEDGEVLHGESATRRGLSDPTRVVREFKRRVGDSTPMVVGQTPYSADVLLAKLLRFANAAVFERQGGAPASIAVTHPANWGDYKIDVLQQAVRMADVGPVTTLTEPVAAAIHYAATERLDPGQTVAVYDLGGGTFDAAVLRRTSGTGLDGAVGGVGFEVLGDVEGIERLGGIDFDEAVFHHAIRWCESAVSELDPDDPGVVQALARLRQECIEAKEALSTDTDVSIPVVLPNLQTEVRLTRSEFEAMIRPLLQQTVDAMHRAIRSSGVAVDELAAILLVGGSSRVPLIAEMVGADLGRPIAVDQHPKHTVALGAAIAAGQAAGDDVPGLVSTAPPVEAVPPVEAPVPSATSGAAPAVGGDPVTRPGTAAVGGAPLAAAVGAPPDGNSPRTVAPAAGSAGADESQLVPLARGEGDGPQAILTRQPSPAHAESPGIPPAVSPAPSPSTPSGAGGGAGAAAPSGAGAGHGRGHAGSSPPAPVPAPAERPPEAFAAPPAAPRATAGPVAGGPAKPFDHRQVVNGGPPPPRGRGALLAVAALIALALVGGGVLALIRSTDDGGQEVASDGGDGPDGETTGATVSTVADDPDGSAASVDGGADETDDIDIDNDNDNDDIVEQTTSTTVIDEETTASTTTETTTTAAADAGRSATITGITVAGGAYAVAYTTTFDPVISGDPTTHHLHFFFDTVGVANAGQPGSGPWILYDGPSPFTGYGPGDRPSGATQLCVVVATHDHALDDASVFDCADLPE